MGEVMNKKSVCSLFIIASFMSSSIFALEVMCIRSDSNYVADISDAKKNELINKANLHFLRFPDASSYVTNIKNGNMNLTCVVYK